MTLGWTIAALFGAFVGGIAVGWGLAMGMMSGGKYDDEMDELYFDRERDRRFP